MAQPTATHYKMFDMLVENKQFLDINLNLQTYSGLLYMIGMFESRISGIGVGRVGRARIPQRMHFAESL